VWTFREFDAFCIFVISLYVVCVYVIRYVMWLCVHGMYFRYVMCFEVLCGDMSCLCDNCICVCDGGASETVCSREER
jgi:hypothetical protein